MKKYIPRIIGIGKLQRQASNVIEEIIKSGEDGVIVSRNEPKVVIMNLSRYEQLKELEEKSSEEEEILEIVKQGDREFQKGKTIKATSLEGLL